MAGSEIFVPFVGMLTLTFVVWVVLYVRRITYMMKHRINPQDSSTPEKGKALLPENINLPAYNLSNLFELPVVFYALCLYLFVSGSVDQVYVAAAWIFFVLRVMHSIVHCTINRVMLRFKLYALSALALWFMLGRVLLGILA